MKVEMGTPCLLEPEGKPTTRLNHAVHLSGSDLELDGGHMLLHSALIFGFSERGGTLECGVWE
jgi:hypothetical protein